MDCWVISSGGVSIGQKLLQVNCLSHQADARLGQHLGGGVGLQGSGCYGSWPGKQWMQCARIPAGQPPRVEAKFLLEARPYRMWDSAGSG